MPPSRPTPRPNGRARRGSADSRRAYAAPLAVPLLAAALTVPGAATALAMPPAPGVPGAPLAPDVPGVPSAPGVPGAPLAPDVPGVPLAPAPPAPPAAAVWSGVGHVVVCGIAWRRLTPEARALVTALIPGEDGRAFAESCVWADQVRSTTHAHTAAYHYINIPAGVDGVDLSRDCGDAERRCVTWAIPHYARILADRGAGETERREALMFLGHFVGDLHQPLHAGRPEDLGGNRVYVDFFGGTGTAERPLSLHAVWDRHILARGGLAWPESAALLEAAITPGEAAGWEDFDVVGWTDESYRLAEAYVYGRLPADRRIRNAYFRPAVGFSEVRVQQAGVRLAHLLHHAATGTLAFPEPLAAAR